MATKKTKKTRTVTLKPGDVLTIKRAPSGPAKKRVPAKAAKKKAKATKPKTIAKVKKVKMPSLSHDPVTGAFIPKAQRVKHWLGLFEKEGLL